MRKILSTLSLAVLLIASPLLLISTAKTANAQSYNSNEGRFSVTFPGNSTVETKSDPIKYSDGSTGTMYEFSVSLNSGNVAYMVMYNDYSSNQANDDPQAILARTRDGAVKGKTLLSDLAINLNGVPGRAFTAKDDNWNYSVRQFYKGKRLYQLIVVGNNANPATQTDQFMNSFKIW